MALTALLSPVLGRQVFSPCAGQEVVIESLARNGVLTWSNASLSVTCRVEWSASAEGPWHVSWDGLTDLAVTNHLTARPVPMFYRVVCTEPPPTLITNVSAQATLDLLVSRASDPNFWILDVRTPSEYSPRHIRGALNLDFRAADFASRLDAMDRTRTYLVYCASGSRSGQATQVMQTKGFQYVYNLSTGFSSLVALPGAAPYLEP